MKWLFTPTTTVAGKILNVFTAFAINLLWVIVVKYLLNFLYGYPIFQVWGFPPPPSGLFIFFAACVFAPFFEEALFRYAPITIAKRWGQDKILPTIIITSALFGLAHGQGMISVLVQGVGGFIFSCLYIKNNYSYLSSVAAHALWNISVLYLLAF